MKINALLFFPIALILLIVSIPPKTKSGSHRTITQASLSDSLPQSFLQKVAPIEIQGYCVQQFHVSSTYYFKYSANHTKVLQQIALLPFSPSSVRADVQCRAIAQQSELKQMEELLKDRLIAQTFQREPLINYTIYQCLKTPQHHFLLLSKTSDTVIHIIHQS